MKNLKLLCIHGIGGKDASMNIKGGWGDQWKTAFNSMEFTSSANIELMRFDSFFNDENADWSDYWDFFQITFRNKREQKSLDMYFFDNYPDMVVEFLLNKDGVREKLREELKKKIEEENPDVIYAHSLGSMMCYDFFTQPENSTQYKDIILVTAGSQLGNPKLRNHSLKQPVEMLPVKFWYNLNNSKDSVFARHEIVLPSNKNYKEVSTDFFGKSMGHDGLEYLNHSNAINNVWNQIKNDY